MTDTDMKREIAEIPGAVTRLLTTGSDAIREAARDWRRLDPDLVVTVARGSSDHASAFFKYACELTAGIPVASLGPSIASIYGRKLRLARAVALAISQSGKSPDIVALLESVVRSGASAVAFTNDFHSPLADAANRVVALQAGEERSVAATKTFVTSLVAAVALLAHWQDDHDLLAALDQLPAALEGTLGADWNALERRLAEADSLFVLGRGPSSAIAHEAALKFKETCGLHAEAYSTAEVLHGPSELVGEGFPVLAFLVADEARPSVLETCRRLSSQGAEIFFASAGNEEAGIALPFRSTGHPLLDPICAATAFYGFVEALARRRGLDPDRPRHLRKVTATV